jgi:hypothetical protein
MNINALIAVLLLKGIISQDEAERLVDHINNKPQSTVLSDVIATVTLLLDNPALSILPGVLSTGGPEQQAENQAALAATAQAPAGSANETQKPAMPSDTNDSSVTTEQNAPASQTKTSSDAVKKSSKK